LEGAVLWALFRYNRLLFCTAAALNLLTQAVLIALLSAFPANYWLALAAGEFLVVVVEAAGYALAGRWVTPEWRRGGLMQFSAKNAFLLSLGLNAASFTVGLALPV